MFLTLFTPFIVNEDETQIRALNTLLSVYYFSRLSQLHGSWKPYFKTQPLIVRFGHVYLTFHDSRIRKILPTKTFDVTSFKQLITTSILTAFSVIILRKYSTPTSSFGMAFACIVSGCIGYLSLSIMCALLRFLAFLTGRKFIPSFNHIFTYLSNKQNIYIIFYTYTHAHIYAPSTIYIYESI